MKNERNMLMGDSMSASQMSPNLCDPRDFEVMEAGESGGPQPFHGQCGDSTAEYHKLLKEGDRCANASRFTDEREVHPCVDDARTARE